MSSISSSSSSQNSLSDANSYGGLYQWSKLEQQYSYLKAKEMLALICCNRLFYFGFNVHVQAKKREEFFYSKWCKKNTLQIGDSIRNLLQMNLNTINVKNTPFEEINVIVNDACNNQCQVHLVYHQKNTLNQVIQYQIFVSKNRDQLEAFVVDFPQEGEASTESYGCEIFSRKIFRCDVSRRDSAYNHWRQNCGLQLNTFFLLKEWSHLLSEMDLETLNVRNTPFEEVSTLVDDARKKQRQLRLVYLQKTQSDSIAIFGIHVIKDQNQLQAFVERSDESMAESDCCEIFSKKVFRYDSNNFASMVEVENFAKQRARNYRNQYVGHSFICKEFDFSIDAIPHEICMTSLPCNLGTLKHLIHRYQIISHVFKREISMQHSLSLARDMANSLDLLHQQGLVHGALSPDEININIRNGVYNASIYAPKITAVGESIKFNMSMPPETMMNMLNFKNSSTILCREFQIMEYETRSFWEISCVASFSQDVYALGRIFQKLFTLKSWEPERLDQKIGKWVLSQLDVVNYTAHLYEGDNLDKSLRPLQKDTMQEALVRDMLLPSEVRLNIKQVVKRLDEMIENTSISK